MALPSTGPLSMSQVNVELGYASTRTTSLNESAVRALAGRPSGAISFSDLRGKSANTIVNVTIGRYTTGIYDYRGFWLDGTGGAWLPGNSRGSRSPTTYNGATIGALAYSAFGPRFVIAMAGSRPQNFLGSFQVQGLTVGSLSEFFTESGYTNWIYNVTGEWPTSGTRTVTFP